MGKESTFIVAKRSAEVKVTTLYEQFDDFGNARKVTVSAAGVPSRETQYQYDPKGRFATRVTNTLGQHTTYTYDGRWGQPLTVTDISGLTASSQYDAFGRLKQSTDPLGHTSTTTMAWDIGTYGNSVYRMETQTPGAPDGKVWMDAFNREVRAEAEGFDAPVMTMKFYDQRGRTVGALMPNPKTGGGQPILQVMEYNNHNRMEHVTDGTRSTSSVYSASGSTYNTTVNDPGGRERTQKMDATGKVTESNDPGGSLTFTYHANGKVKKTVGHGGKTLTEMTYDDFGNQKTLTDIDGGLTQYGYNPFGELTSQIDALENEHVMQYDAMGRIMTRTGPDGVVTYQYVTHGNGLNQLRKATFVSGGTTTMQEYTYDAFGRVLSQKETVQDDEVKTFTTSYTYDDLGRVATMTYPSGLVLSYEYDANSHLKKVKNGGTVIYELEDKNALGQVIEYTLGNGITTTKTINEHGHLTDIVAPGVQNLTMEFDPHTGNLEKRKNNLTNVQEDFVHDDSDRLELAYVDEDNMLQVEYDDNGNIDTKSDAGEYDYHDNKIHAVTKISNEEENISLVEQNITYTPWGRRTATINEGEHNAIFTYGPDNERKKLAMQVDYETVTTRYYSGNYEEYKAPNGDLYKLSYVNGGDGLCAIHVMKNSEQPQFYYVYKDHLGSILTLTDDEGDIEGEQSFDAWGRYRDPATWEVLNSDPADGALVVDMPVWMSRGYTGHEHLQEFDLINMNGRMYDPLQARMLAVDNYVQDPYSTQAYNRYSYAWNNPLSYTDPSGEYLIKYLTDAYNKNTLDPYGWGNGNFSNMQFQVGYSQGNVSIGFSPDGSVPMMYGNFNISSGNFSASSYPYVNPRQAVSIGGGIDWSKVERAKADLYDFAHSGKHELILTGLSLSGEWIENVGLREFQKQNLMQKRAALRLGMSTDRINMIIRNNKNTLNNVKLFGQSLIVYSAAISAVDINTARRNGDKAGESQARLTMYMGLGTAIMPTPIGLTVYGLYLSQIPIDASITYSQDPTIHFNDNTLISPPIPLNLPHD